MINNSSIIESLHNLKGCLSNVDKSEGVIYIMSLSMIIAFVRNISIFDPILQLLVLEIATENTMFFLHNDPH